MPSKPSWGSVEAPLALRSPRASKREKYLKSYGVPMEYLWSTYGVPMEQHRVPSIAHPVYHAWPKGAPPNLPHVPTCPACCPDASPGLPGSERGGAPVALASCENLLHWGN